MVVVVSKIIANINVGLNKVIKNWIDAINPLEANRILVWVKDMVRENSVTLKANNVDRISGENT